MVEAIPYEKMLENIKDDIDYVARSAYVKGYNTAKAEITLSKEYEPERKMGEWEYVERREPQWDIFGMETWANIYKCSKCDFRHAFIQDHMCYNFCPNCGTDMREGEKN